jgi:hypothetical protein
VYAEETDDWESSKLVWVVGVDRDDVGESGLKNWGIGVKSRMRSGELSWTKDVIKSSLRSKKVVGGDEDIKTIAGADGAGDSATITWGIEFICEVCVSEGVRRKTQVCLKILRNFVYFER